VTDCVVVAAAADDDGARILHLPLLSKKCLIFSSDSFVSVFLPATTINISKREMDWSVSDDDE
jgi:hypothetical protein